MGEPVHSPDALSGAEHWFAAADTDHDGRLTPAEMRADAMRFFKILDVDRDGQIGPAEIERYETEVAPEIRVGSTYGVPTESSGSDSDPKEPPYPDRLGAGRYSYIDLPEPVVSMDLNFDRAISAQEFLRAAQKRFALLDADHNGVLTRDELPALKSVDTPRPRRRRHGRRP